MAYIVGVQSLPDSPSFVRNANFLYFPIIYLFDVLPPAADDEVAG